jgi:hypothetical protein
MSKLIDQNNIKVSKNELINTFSEIDSKINNLHTRSSSDFLQLNNYLKDYHNKMRIVSENAFSILETIAGKKDLDLIKELGKIHQRLEDCRGKIKEEDFRKIQALKEIIIKSNQINVGLRNMKQDFTTFKFLFSNYNILSNYEDFKIEWKNSIEIWNKEIQSIQESLPSIRCQVDGYKEQITASIGRLELRVEKSLKVFQNLSKEIKTNIGSVVLKGHESNLQFPLLKEKTADSSKSISNIITHLQYHDIIRQKIEHIQKSHYKIIDDLSISIGKNNDEMIENLLDVYLKIGDIADLQAAQLLLVSKEYQNALSIITRNFQCIANDLTTISSISNEFSYKDNNSEITLLKQIKNQLDDGIIMLDLNNFREINAEFTQADKKLEEISDQIKRDIQGPLNKLSQSGKLENNESGKTVSRPGVLTQIISITNDIEIKNQEICDIINEIRNLSASIFTIEDLETRGNQLEQDRIELMVNISRILDTLDKDNEELDNVLNENRDLNNNILEKIENVINKVDYYDYFEIIVEQVINQLNSINNRLKPVLPGETREDKAANLKDIKATYTMESERIIHEKVVTGSKESDNIIPKNEADEIEFF